MNLEIPIGSIGLEILHTYGVSTGLATIPPYFLTYEQDLRGLNSVHHLLNE